MKNRRSLSTLLALAICALLGTVATADAGTCAGLSGSALSSCRQYCNKLRCQEGSTDSRCANVRARFLKVTGACQLPCDCGNGSVSGCEQCDDGNAVDTDACTNQCSANYCGDGSVLVGVEACDDGNASNSDGCKTDCTLNTCGDGVVWNGVEACDDGNASNNDACKNDCTFNSCGDGSVRTGVEACDDGNASNNDACTNDCTVNVCGDGFVRNGVEACDDGNALDTDACKTDCSDNFCGDGAAWYGVEECDDSNPLDDDECKSDCTLNVCNDGSLWTGVEECEDFNSDNGDECKNDCTFNVCGDGVVRTGVETCDGGLENPFDACTDLCEYPVVDSPFLEDVSFCRSATTDHYVLPILTGEAIEISVDTVDAETASDLCVSIDCPNDEYYEGDNEVPCTFPGPGTSACPSVSFTAEADGNCAITVSVCEEGCLDELLGRYALTATRSGQNAQLTFESDDD